MEIARIWRLKETMIQFRGEIGPDGIPHFPPGKVRPIDNSASERETGKETAVIFSSRVVSMSSK
jgi:hypothetical protein